MKDPKNADSPQSQGAKGLIFVIDDEPMLLELAVVILEPLGFVVRTFRDAETAVEAFDAAKPRPDLVITDYSMHAMTGLELIKECRRLQPRQRVLLVSGTVDEHAYRNSPIKPDSFLPKPYQPKELVDMVTNLVSV
jgi:CheY-like chemotaxis protein